MYTMGIMLFSNTQLWQNEGRVSRRLPVTTSSDTGAGIITCRNNAGMSRKNLRRPAAPSLSNFHLHPESRWFLQGGIPSLAHDAGKSIARAALIQCWSVNWLGGEDDPHSHQVPCIWLPCCRRYRYKKNPSTDWEKYQVQHVLNDNPFSGHLFILPWLTGWHRRTDADGLCLFTKRSRKASLSGLRVRDGIHYPPATRQCSR